MSIARTQIIDGSIAPSPGDITNDPKQTIGFAIGYSNSKATYRDWGKNLLSMMLFATSGTISSDCFGRMGSIRGRDGKKSNSQPVDNKQTQAAQCVDKPKINARRFLGSKAIKALLGKGYTPDSFEDSVCISSIHQRTAPDCHRARSRSARQPQPISHHRGLRLFSKITQANWLNSTSENLNFSLGDDNFYEKSSDRADGMEKITQVRKEE